MNSGRALRRLAALGLLLALLPLPFTGIVLPPFWIAAAAAAVLAYRRRRAVALSNTVMNVLAVLFVVVVLVAGGWRVGPLRPLGQLLVLLAAVRVVMVRDRRSFRGGLVPVGLVWILAVASSTHVTLIVYLALSMGALWWGGMRAFLVSMAPEERVESLRGLPRPRHAAVAALAVLLLAVPVFFAMPRLRSPVLAAGRGSAGVTGFHTSVDLSGVGELRRSGQVAMVVSLRSPGELEADWLRLRATAFNLLRTGSWVPRRTGARPLAGGGEIVRLDEGRTALDAAISLEIDLLRPQGYLFIPPGTVALRCGLPVSEDRAGGLLLPRSERRPVSYTVWLRPGFRGPMAPPGKLDRFVPRSRTAVESLARTVTSGARSPADVARAVEGFLRSNFQYTLHIPRRFSNDPVADFLFIDQRGHCELFAGAMVMMLRSVGIPARMIGGYAGGDLGPTGRVAHVRQSNAHTWVEVWLGGSKGWTVYDPTPAEDVPGVERASLVNWLRWKFDKIQVLWDRYILTFGLQDQMDLVTASVSAVLGALHSLRPGVVGVALIIVCGIAWLLLRPPWHRRDRRGSRGAAEVSRVLARLARRIERSGVDVPLSATPRRVAGEAAALWPGLAGELEELARVAELELYGPGAGPGVERRVRAMWKALKAGMGSGRSSRHSGTSPGGRGG